MVIVVQEHGAKIRRRGNCLYIKSETTEREISADKVKELHVFQSASISSDAIQLCIEKDIWIIFMDIFGNPSGEILPFSGGSSPIYKRKQLLLADREEGVELAKYFLIQKIENRIMHLEEILLDAEEEDIRFFLSERVKRMQLEIEKIQSSKSDRIATVRHSLQGFEGNAGKAYFECISYMLPKNIGFIRRERNSCDLYNCSLNYLYGILYAQIKREMFRCRLDPYIGVMHVDTYNKPTFVFDFIEGQRILCERLSFELCKNGQISDANMEIADGKHCFTQEGKRILIKAYRDKMHEKTVYKKKRLTWENKIHSELTDVAIRIGEMKDDLLDVV